MTKKMKFLAATLLTIWVAATHAQVTTSSMSGRVTDKDGAVIGATVVATHEPSGTTYGTVTNMDGRYTLNGMRVGGPYKVEVSYIGYGKSVTEGITLRLGDNYVHNVSMQEETVALGEVVVSAFRNPVLNSDRTGASMNVSSREINTLPTISRSITDFTRLTPQASGNSFAGRDGRMNTITVDGSAFNNNFGLSSNPMPGGNAQPISLDAIEEIAVNIAPFDITLSQFTGASINAVTKSGTNAFKGSFYTFQRPKSFTGEKVGDLIVAGARERNAQTYGLTLGGPIVKNKLFFFLSGELENEVSPSNSWIPSTDGKADPAKKIARTTEADLQRMSDYLKQKYSYDPGKYKDFDNFSSKNYKLMARLDWNIHNDHRLTLRYNDVKSSNDVLTNSSSGPFRLSSSRISAQSIAFQNAFYGFENTVRSVAAELNSKLSDNLRNKLLATYTGVKDKRTSNSAPFPFVDIMNGNDHYMAFGYELFSYNNQVENNTLSIVNNLTYSLGSHTFTGGLAYDQMYFNNAFLPEGTSYYRYASMDDFINDKAPVAFGVAYGYKGNDAPSVELSFGLGALYLQDEWRVNDRLKLTAGVRAELPFYLNKLENNPAISALKFKDGWGDGVTQLHDYKMNVGEWPKARIQISPRLGFNWDVMGDRSLQLRGGTGLFTGLLPFVWFTNQPANAGMMQSPEITTKDPADLAKLKFNPDYRAQIAAHPDLFPQTPGKLPSGANLAEVAKDFRMPQLWRTNIAADIALPYNMVLTLEGLYSKDINAVVQRNLNLPLPDKTIKGADNRPYWSANRIEADVATAMVLSNTSKGYQASFTAQLTKNFSNGLSGMVAYTYNLAKDVSTNPGSRAHSAWQNNTVVSYLNNPELSYSSFAMPHRVVGSLSYRIEYARHFATTLSLYYSGMHQGRYSYAYSNDMNGDGTSADLLYIPATKDEIKFIDAVDPKDNTKIAMTAAEQADAFWNYVENTPYLKKNKGRYAERFGDVQGWLNRFDLKILQDLFTNFGADRRYTLQVSLDIINVGNLLNSAWGVYKSNGLASYDRIRPLTQASGYRKSGGRWVPKNGLQADGTSTYVLNASSLEDFNKKTQWTNALSTGSTWGMLLGVKFIF